jgi:hypothetical protein
MPIKKKTALLASILAGALICVAAGTAEARHGGGGHWGGGGGHWSGGGHWRGGHWGGMAARSHAFSGGHRFAFRHHRHHRVFAFAPYYYDSYGYGDGCYWLKRRAAYTGSRYWWNRYYGCVNGYGYY